MKTLLSLLLLLFPLFGFAQADTVILEFLNQVITRKHDTSAIFYTDKVHAGMYDYMMKDSVIKRTTKDLFKENDEELTLTSEEINYLKQQLITVKDKKWAIDLFTNSTRIPTDSMNSFLYQNRSRDLYLFSPPVFIRNNTIALFYVVHLCCGGIYGPVDLSFYRKNGEAWQRWIRVYHSDF